VAYWLLSHTSKRAADCQSPQLQDLAQTPPAPAASEKQPLVEPTNVDATKVTMDGPVAAHGAGDDAAQTE
jgi:hypothetical protein